MSDSKPPDPATGSLDPEVLLTRDDAVLMLDREGRVLACTRAAERILRLTNAQLRGRGYALLFPDRDARAGVPARLLDLALESPGARHDGSLLRGDGGEFRGQMRVSTVGPSLRSFTGYAVVIQDVSSTGEKVPRPAGTEALAAMRGLVHDCNNFLMVAINRLAAFKRQVDRTDPAWRRLHDLDEALERVGALLQQSLAVEPGGAAARVSTSLNDVATRIAGLLQGLLASAAVRLELQLEPSLPPVEADPLGMEQVLMNLILNAKQAMPSGGTIELETITVELLKKVSRSGRHILPGRYARVSIVDSGCGMTASAIARALDLSGASEPSDNRERLGLSSCLRIVTNHGGEMTIDSAPGRGTRVDVYLPWRQSTVLQRPPELNWRSREVGGPEPRA